MTLAPRGTDHIAMVAATLAAETGLRPADIGPDQALTAIPGAESVKILRAVVRLEEEYGISVPDDFLFETATVRDLADLVARLAAGSR